MQRDIPASAIDSKQIISHRLRSHLKIPDILAQFLPIWRVYISGDIVTEEMGRFWLGSISSNEFLLHFFYHFRKWAFFHLPRQCFIWHDHMVIKGGDLVRIQFNFFLKILLARSQSSFAMLRMRHIHTSCLLLLMELTMEFRNVNGVIEEWEVALCVFVDRGSEFAIEVRTHLSRLLLHLPLNEEASGYSGPHYSEYITIIPPTVRVICLTKPLRIQTSSALL